MVSRRIRDKKIPQPQFDVDEKQVSLLLRNCDFRTLDTL